MFALTMVVVALGLRFVYVFGQASLKKGDKKRVCLEN